MAPHRGTTVAKSDFPMYTINVLDERHFLVAGGGGQAKTGVSNAIVSHVYLRHFGQEVFRPQILFGTCISNLLYTYVEIKAPLSDCYSTNVAGRHFHT